MSMPNRVYPIKKVGSQVVGYVDLEGSGVTGIEKEFEQYLKGKDGWADTSFTFFSYKFFNNSIF